MQNKNLLTNMFKDVHEQIPSYVLEDIQRPYSPEKDIMQQRLVLWLNQQEWRENNEYKTKPIVRVKKSRTWGLSLGVGKVVSAVTG